MNEALNLPPLPDVRKGEALSARELETLLLTVEHPHGRRMMAILRLLLSETRETLNCELVATELVVNIYRCQGGIATLDAAIHQLSDLPDKDSWLEEKLHGLLTEARKREETPDKKATAAQPDVRVRRG